MNFAMAADARTASLDQLVNRVASPEFQRQVRLTQLVSRPISGFLWGALVSALIAKSGQRKAAGLEGGLYGAGINFGRALLCLPDGMTGVCLGVSAVPAVTAAGVYVGLQHR